MHLVRIREETKMRVPMIAGNWKMNTTVSEAIELVNELRQGLDQIDNVDKVISPVSLKYCLRSECPIITNSHRSASIGGEISPV